MVKFAMFSASGVQSIKVAIGEIDVINCNSFVDTIIAIRSSKRFQGKKSKGKW